MRAAPATVGYIDPLNACFGRVLHGAGGVGKYQFMRRIDGSIMRFDHGNKNFRSDKLCLNIGCGKRKRGGIIAAPESVNLLQNDFTNGRVMCRERRRGGLAY